MNILPMYVILLGLAPLALEAFRRNLPALFFVPSVLVYAVGQVNPELLRYTHPASGTQFFVLAGWQLVFFMGFGLGYYRDALAKRVWPAHRRWLLPASAAVYGLLFLVAQLHRNSLRPRLPFAMSPGVEQWLFGRETHGVGLLLFFWVKLLVLLQVADWWCSRRWGAGLREQLAFLGQHSLFTFVAHIPLALLARAVGTDAWPMLAQNALCVAGVVAIYLLARHYPRLLAALPRAGAGAPAAPRP
jgi:hypothetical protein